jgi:hypothetical protein
MSFVELSLQGRHMWRRHPHGVKLIYIFKYPNWTKFLDSTTHGEGMAKRRDPNRPEVWPAGPTSRLTSLVFALNESSLLNTCTAGRRAKCPPLVPISLTTPTSNSYKYLPTPFDERHNKECQGSFVFLNGQGSYHKCFHFQIWRAL